MKLNELGWNNFFEEQMKRWEGSGLMAGRVVSVAGAFYIVESEQGRRESRVSGHFQYIAAGREDYPAVGDWVLLRGEGELLIIERVLERKSRFSRRAAGRTSDEQVIAANIDIMFITASLEGGRNFTLRGIERYIVMVSDGGAQPVIILNKCDLCTEDEREDYLMQVKQVSGDIPVLMVSARSGEGVERIHELLKQGVTAAFTGPSGAGKSALINRLTGEEIQRTGELREADLRGRHTTTSRELFFTGSGGMVIDTPGLRELRPFGERDSLDSAFTEIAEAAKGCRFTDCSHKDEPGCEVLRLVSEGAIEYERYQNYITIRDEMISLDMMKSEKGRMERKAKEKTISKLVKSFYRESDKY